MMTNPQPPVGQEAAPRADVRPGRAHYQAPTLERLGAWKALTLQQTVPVSFFGSVSAKGLLSH